ncbi:hypothetical protein [Ruegeria lacuscaerulensis]|uniref:hypothetical protein n=1 Tax=Ruegeria lacuscaerulensis TaxID=55218 RepID=UPI0014809F5E|nr:hypothetical protein [Ruegeria lacuscaerulensis]
MFLKFNQVAPIAILFTANTVAFADQAQNLSSLFSCKFGPECTRNNQDCKKYDIWMIVRHYKSEDQYKLFDALNSHEQEAEFGEIGELLVFDSMSSGNGEKDFGAFSKMVIASTMEASLQGGAMWRMDDLPTRYTSYSHDGACTVIN